MRTTMPVRTSGRAALFQDATHQSAVGRGGSPMNTLFRGIGFEDVVRTLPSAFRTITLVLVCSTLLGCAALKAVTSGDEEGSSRASAKQSEKRVPMPPTTDDFEFGEGLTADFD